MARKKTPRKKRTRRPRPWTRVADGLRTLPWPGRAAARGVAWLVGLAALGTAAGLGVPRLEAALADATATQTVTIEFAGRPAWVNADLLDVLDRTALRQLTPDPLDRVALVRAREALLATAWFDRIEQVRRGHDGRVTVEGVFATPAAVIRDEDGDHLVDGAGRLLPMTFEHGRAERQLVITGVHFDRPQQLQRPWDGADVSAALRLRRVIEGRPWRDQVRAIDASRYLTDETLVITTDLGARIVWGRPPGEESGLEASTERKLGYLDTAYREFGRIDTGHRGTLHFYERGYFADPP